MLAINFGNYVPAQNNVPLDRSRAFIKAAYERQCAIATQILLTSFQQLGCYEKGLSYEGFKISCSLTDVKELGKGSFGTVSVLKPPLDGYVVKAIRPQGNEASECALALKEWNILGHVTALNSPYFPKVLATVVRPSCKCMIKHYSFEALAIMTRAEGDTIFNCYVEKKGLLDTMPKIARISYQILDAQKCLIENFNLVHADPNEKNIFLDWENFNIMFVDFGNMAKVTADVLEMKNLCAPGQCPPEVYYKKKGSMSQGIIFSTATLVFLLFVREPLLDWEFVYNNYQNSASMDQYMQQKLLRASSKDGEVTTVKHWEDLMKDKLDEMQVPDVPKILFLNFMDHSLSYDPSKRFFGPITALEHSFFTYPLNDASQSASPAKEKKTGENQKMRDPSRTTEYEQDDNRSERKERAKESKKVASYENEQKDFGNQKKMRDPSTRTEYEK